MTALLKRIKTKLFIASYKKSLNALEGQYTSAMRGRSLDFDDLREYSIGDEVKDIDWKASARSANPLVKQYVASRKQPVIFVVDGGKNMSAVTDSNETKRDIAISTVGVLGYLAVRHSDSVGLVIGHKQENKRLPNRETESHLERILQAIQFSQEEPAESDIVSQLKYIQKNVKNRTLLVIVADEVPLVPEINTLLKRIQAQHEVLWISIGDGDPLSQVPIGKGIVEDISSGNTIPDYIRMNKKLKEKFLFQETVRKSSIEELVVKAGISHTTIGSEQQVVSKLLKLLERRLHGRRR